jgi:phage terminase large subunit-like protein
VILDDPIKGRKDAESKTIRDATMGALEDDLQTRYIPGAWMVLVQTRWHDEDVAGSLLPEDYAGESGLIMCRDGLEWEVINLVAKIENQQQAENDPLGRAVGEYLWPEWFDRKHWRIYEPRPGDPNSPSERRWAALFQQNPRPDGGNQWEREWVQWYDLGHHPKYLNYYTSSDYSVSEGSGDFTEHGVAGLDENGELWLVDWWYGQVAPDQGVDALLTLAKRWGATQGFDEGGLIEKAIKPIFRQRQRQTGTYLKIDYLPTIGNKVARFQSFRGMGSAGKVHIPNCPWGHRLVDELCKFGPGVTRDDVADCCAGFGRGLEGMIWSRERVPAPKKKGLKFGSWEWLTYGTENEDKGGARVY